MRKGVQENWVEGTRQIILYLRKKAVISHNHLKLGEATVYQKHRSLRIRKKLYKDWRLPGAEKLSGDV